MIVRARTPLRISYAGGGTDVDPFKEDYGGAVLNSAINKYCHGALKKRKDGGIGIKAHDLGVSLQYSVGTSIMYDGNLDLIKAVIKHLQDKLNVKIGGFDIETFSDAPPGSGLGTSSAVVVTILGLVLRAYGVNCTEKEIADMAWIIERRDMELSGGFQDQYTAVYGGQINYMEFHSGFNVIVNQLKINRWILNELQESLTMFFTGGLHKSHDIIVDQNKNSEPNKHHLQEMKAIAKHMKDCLLIGNFSEFSELLLHEWEIKKRLSKLITNQKIDEMASVALENGARGLKVTGAGGGGMMLVLSDQGNRVQITKAMQNIGAIPVDFELVKPGMETWVVGK